MNTKWIEKVIGSFEAKRRYRQHKKRVKQLPESHRMVVCALERYLMVFGPSNNFDTLQVLFDEIVDLFERSAADGAAIREVVGEDPMEFVEELLRAYPDESWITKEQRKLTRAIDRAAEQQNGGTA